MIKQEKDYIARRKKKFLSMSLVWAGVVLVIFIAGLMLTKSRNNYFTLMAAIFVLPLAQNITRFISFNRFKDPDPEFASVLEQMKGSYQIFHSAIIPDTMGTILFEHLIVTSKSIYFLSYNKNSIDTNSGWIQNRLSAKGIPLKQIHFIHIASINNIKNTALKIEKDACYTSEILDQNTKVIETMLM
ncbi:MAG: hypothetical protein K0S71_1367 [Clostridia bacterium]|jgi:hypothetical protein|nr:hypothetical protein [Clostridia bacterium]